MCHSHTHTHTHTICMPFMTCNFHLEDLSFFVVESGGREEGERARDTRFYAFLSLYLINPLHYNSLSVHFFLSGGISYNLNKHAEPPGAAPSEPLFSPPPPPPRKTPSTTSVIPEVSGFVVSLLLDNLLFFSPWSSLSVLRNGQHYQFLSNSLGLLS